MMSLHIGLFSIHFAGHWTGPFNLVTCILYFGEIFLTFLLIFSPLLFLFFLSGTPNIWKLDLQDRYLSGLFSPYFVCLLAPHFWEIFPTIIPSLEFFILLACLISISSFLFKIFLLIVSCFLFHEYSIFSESVKEFHSFRFV